MDVGVVALIALLAAGLGVLIAWLVAGRKSAVAAQTVETLRLQLDEVIKERDANQLAARDLTALQAAR